MNKTNYNFLSQILEKRITNNDHLDLSVIGYSSKLYRDDDKAVEIDEGKHLIAWMGNEDLKIDRYDVRSYFNNLSQCETDEVFNYNISEEDIQVEEMCEQERYRALLHDEQEQELYKEEEQKRAKQSFSKAREYSQVSYHYDGTESIPETVKNTPSKGGVTLSSNNLLNCPSNITVPNSDNVNEIIKKTAECVAKHGCQMEVLIKTRQAQNAIFNFLTVGNDLNPYYQYILEAIKTGQYKMGRYELSDNTDCDQVSSFPFNVQLAPTVPDVNSYVLSENCPYNMLVNKIRQLNKNEVCGGFKIEGPECSENSQLSNDSPAK